MSARRSSSSSSRAWIAAASVGAVEALKDQGFCRWNYAMRSLHQQAKTNLSYLSQAQRRCPNPRSSQSSSSSSSSPVASSRVREEEAADKKTRQSEESLRKVMFLSSWGPY